MADISFQQVLNFVYLQNPHKYNLDSNGRLLAKRSPLRNLIGWVVFVITFGQVPRNKALDVGTQKIIKATRQALQNEPFSSFRKESTIHALRNVVIMIDTNSGSRRKEVDQLIRQVQQKAVASQAENTPLSLESEVERVKRCDRLLDPPQPHDWRAGPGRDERKQTLQSYQAQCPQDLKGRRILKIQQIGQFSTAERKALRITADYITAVHGVQVELDSQIHNIEGLKQQHRTFLQQRNVSSNNECFRPDFASPRKRGGQAPQYHIDHLCKIAITQFQKGDRGSNALCFTQDDIYAEGMNFIFGVAIPENHVGVFSIHRLGNADQHNNCLKRLMKLASHEFAHLRGIEHCTDHACNIQGCNTNAEMDKTPLIFCAEDMAKIALCNGQTMKESYRRQLEFFENFSQKYGFDVDFSTELANLRARIRMLS